MITESLDRYDCIPEDMEEYLSNYGRHFNHKLLEFAVSKMQTKDNNGKTTPLSPMSKEYVDALLKRFNIKLNNNQLSDYIYVANMCKADFLGSSIIDEHHMALYVKDVIDDVDGCDGIIFNRWYASTRRIGIPIDWYDMI